MINGYIFLLRSIIVIINSVWGDNVADEKMISFPHNLTLEERNRLLVSGVTDIGGYDEQTVVAQTEKGELTVKGEGLHIIRMSVDMGELAVEGNIISMQYSETQPAAGFFSRLFR